jgi:predicted GNAT family acetyltransferase
VSTTRDDQITIADDPGAHRYEARVGDELAGFVQYRRRPGLIAFIHTEVDARYEGRGLASALIAGALDAARETGTAVLPFCPFVNGFVQRHREYVELVPAEHRGRFGL